jgi:hypothetical protein
MKNMQAVLLPVTTVAVCSILGIQLVQVSAEHHAAVEQHEFALANRAYQAWRYAMTPERLLGELSSSGVEPKRSKVFLSRTIWAKSFQHSDAKPIASKYGNAAYEVSTIITIGDGLAQYQFTALIEKVTTKALNDALATEPRSSFAMQCKVEQLDSGEWISSDYKFVTSSKEYSYPNEVIKEDKI